MSTEEKQIQAIRKNINHGKKIYKVLKAAKLI